MYRKYCKLCIYELMYYSTRKVCTYLYMYDSVCMYSCMFAYVYRYVIMQICNYACISLRMSVIMHVYMKVDTPICSSGKQPIAYLRFHPASFKCVINYCTFDRFDCHWFCIYAENACALRTITFNLKLNKDRKYKH